MLHNCTYFTTTLFHGMVHLFVKIGALCFSVSNPARSLGPSPFFCSPGVPTTRIPFQPGAAAAGSGAVEGRSGGVRAGAGAGGGHAGVPRRLGSGCVRNEVLG